MRVHLVSPDQQWILNKIATQIQKRSGASRGQAQDASADINYYINWHVFTYYQKTAGIDLLFCTHINKGEEQLVYDTIMRADHATMISTYAMQQAIDMGIPADKMTLILLPIDEDWKPRKIRLGIPCRWYMDGRREEWMLLELAKRGVLQDFQIHSMGPGWEGVLYHLATYGVKCSSMPITHDFTKDHEQMRVDMSLLDYTIHMGIEGTIGVAEGLAMGVPTIHRKAGQALDIATKGSYWFDTLDELQMILSHIKNERHAIGAKAREQQWPVYVAQLEALWQRLCA